MGEVLQFPRGRVTEPDEIEELVTDDGDGGGPTEIVVRVIVEYPDDPEPEPEPEPKGGGFWWAVAGALFGFSLG